MQDSHGHIFWVKGGPTGNKDAIYAELMGLLEGLILLKNKGIRDCAVEGDSLTVIT